MLRALPIGGDYSISLVEETGMFSNPACSKHLNTGGYLIAYLEAIFPEQSDTSRYRLIVIDRDGSNRKVLFPQEGSPGLNPQQVTWSPDTTDPSMAYLALVYQGNLWLIDAITGANYQVTGDSLATRISWR
jgi:hypothetical protein